MKSLFSKFFFYILNLNIISFGNIFYNKSEDFMYLKFLHLKFNILLLLRIYILKKKKEL